MRGKDFASRVRGVVVFLRDGLRDLATDGHAVRDGVLVLAVVSGVHTVILDVILSCG